MNRTKRYVLKLHMYMDTLYMQALLFCVYGRV